MRLCEVETVSLNPHTLEEIAQSVELVAVRLGVPERGAEVAGEMRAAIAATAALVDGLPRRRIFVAEWLDPPFASGHWVPEMVTLAGGDCVLGTAGETSVTTTWEAVRDAAPDVVVVAPCGYGLAESVELGRALLGDGPLGRLLAERGDRAPRVWAVDANASFARPGPRVVDGTEALAAVLAPDRFGDPDPAMARRLS